MLKKVKRDVFGLTTLGIGVGVGSSLAPGINLSPLASKMPIMGNMIGTGLVLDQLQKLQKTIKKNIK